MSSRSIAEILWARRDPSGGMLAVGLRWDAGLFVQEYWSQGVPHYAIANVSEKPAQVAVREWKAGVGRRLLGPWSIAPNAVACQEIQELVTGYAGELIAISLDDTEAYGLLKAPRPLLLPFDGSKREGIFTIEGLNGMGDRDAGLLFRQERLVLAAGGTTSLTLWVPGSTGLIRFDGADSSCRLPQAAVVGATSETLPVESREGSVLIGAHASESARRSEVTLTVQLPRVARESMAALLGRVASPSGGEYAFGRGLIVSA